MFKEKLRALRKRNGLTQVALASMLDVSQQTVAKWESGIVTPSMEAIKKIAECFQIDIAELLNDLVADAGARESAIDVNTHDRIKAIIDLIGSFEVRLPVALAVDELSPDCRDTVGIMLRENDSAMTHADNALSLVVDSLIICSLELSKVNLDKAIATLNKEHFDMADALTKAKLRVSVKLEKTGELLYAIMKKLPEELFEPPSVAGQNKGGDSNGNSEAENP